MRASALGVSGPGTFQARCIPPRPSLKIPAPCHRGRTIQLSLRHRSPRLAGCPPLSGANVRPTHPVPLHARTWLSSLAASARSDCHRQDLAAHPKAKTLRNYFPAVTQVPSIPGSANAILQPMAEDVQTAHTNACDLMRAPAEQDPVQCMQSATDLPTHTEQTLLNAVARSLLTHKDSINAANMVLTNRPWQSGRVYGDNFRAWHRETSMDGKESFEGDHGGLPTEGAHHEDRESHGADSEGAEAQGRASENEDPDGRWSGWNYMTWSADKE